MTVEETKITLKKDDKHHIVVNDFDLELVVNVSDLDDEYMVDIYVRDVYDTTHYYLKGNQKTLKKVLDKKIKDV